MAASLLHRAWFLPRTPRVNPHLHSYRQQVPSAGKRTFRILWSSEHLLILGWECFTVQLSSAVSKLPLLNALQMQLLVYPSITLVLSDGGRNVLFQSSAPQPTNEYLHKGKYLAI